MTTTNDPDAAVYEFDSGAESDPSQLRERTKSKKGRGRPPKKTGGKQVTFEDDGQAEETATATSTVAVTTTSSGPNAVAIAQLKRQIAQMKKRLNAVGTGLDPDAGDYSEEQLQAEFELLNAEVNERRGDKAVHALFQWAVPFVQGVLQRTGKVDVASKYTLVDEVKSSPELFEEVLDQIAIRYGGWFAVGPESALLQNLGACVDSVNRKNGAFHARQQQQQQQQTSLSQQPTPLSTSGHHYADEGPTTAQNSPME